MTELTVDLKLMFHIPMHHNAVWQYETLLQVEAAVGEV